MAESRGLLYIAKNEPFVREAKRSARQVRTVMPDCNIAIITNCHLDNDLFDEIIRDFEEFEKAEKPRLMQETPFEKTIYVDTDIYLQYSIYELFHILNKFDVGLVPDRAEDHIPTNEKDHPIADVPEGFPEFNSGVIAYRTNAKVQKFLEDWQHRCQPHHDYDQRSLRPALYHSNVRFTSLPRRYNCMYRHSGHVSEIVKVFHGPLIDRNEYYVDPKKAVSKLNSVTGPRAFFGFKNTVIVWSGASIPRKFLLTCQIDGPQTALKKAAQGGYHRLKRGLRSTFTIGSRK